MNRYPPTMTVAAMLLFLSVLVAAQVPGNDPNCGSYAKKTERKKGKDCSCHSGCPSGYTEDGMHTDCFGPCNTEWCKRKVDDKTTCATCKPGYGAENNKCARICTSARGKCTSADCTCIDPLLIKNKRYEYQSGCFGCRAELGGVCTSGQDDCEENNQFCDTLLSSSIGTCQWIKKADGNTCSTTAQCTSGACKDGRCAGSTCRASDCTSCDTSGRCDKCKSGYTLNSYKCSIPTTRTTTRITTATITFTTSTTFVAATTTTTTTTTTSTSTTETITTGTATTTTITTPEATTAGCKRDYLALLKTSKYIDCYAKNMAAEDPSITLDAAKNIVRMHDGNELWENTFGPMMESSCQYQPGATGPCDKIVFDGQFCMMPICGGMSPPANTESPPDDNDNTNPPDDGDGDNTNPPDDGDGDNTNPPDDGDGDNTNPPDDGDGDNTNLAQKSAAVNTTSDGSSSGGGGSAAAIVIPVILVIIIIAVLVWWFKFRGKSNDADAAGPARMTIENQAYEIAPELTQDTAPVATNNAAAHVVNVLGSWGGNGNGNSKDTVPPVPANGGNQKLPAPTPLATTAAASPAPIPATLAATNEAPLPPPAATASAEASAPTPAPLAATNEKPLIQTPAASGASAPPPQATAGASVTNEAALSAVPATSDDAEPLPAPPPAADAGLPQSPAASGASAPPPPATAGASATNEAALPAVPATSDDAEPLPAPPPAAEAGLPPTPGAASPLPAPPPAAEAALPLTPTAAEAPAPATKVAVFVDGDPDQEIALYEALFKKKAASTDAELGAGVVAGLLKESGAATSVLRQVWNDAKNDPGAPHGAKGKMNFQEFVVACKLTVKAGGTFASTSDA